MNIAAILLLLAATLYVFAASLTPILLAVRLAIDTVIDLRNARRGDAEPTNSLTRE